MNCLLESDEHITLKSFRELTDGLTGIYQTKILMSKGIEIDDENMIIDDSIFKGETFYATNNKLPD